MAAARYFDLVREMKSAHNHRLRLVESARIGALSLPHVCLPPRLRRFATGCAAIPSRALRAKPASARIGNSVTVPPGDVSTRKGMPRQ